MTTITLDSPSTGRLEELVDRLLAALFKADAATATPVPNLVKTVHEARRLRQSGDLDGSLAVFADVDTANSGGSTPSGWTSPGAGSLKTTLPSSARPRDGRRRWWKGMATAPRWQVASVLGMRWPVGKTVSRRSLRGLKRLAKGGAAWS